jgi:CheY-like chemotaxis protein
MAALPTVLVADDDERVRDLLALMLTRAGFWVLEAEDGAEALDLAACARSCLAVLNLQMPNLDGIAVCRALKADPATAGMPIVILSAAIAPEMQGRARIAGADAYVTKPFSPAALLDVVRRLLPP